MYWLTSCTTQESCLPLCVTLSQVQNAVRISWALDYRLMPLNKDRAFVADSLARLPPHPWPPVLRLICDIFS